MKIDPFELIVKENFKLRKGFYLISGNEFSLMEKIKELIVTTFKVENYSEHQRKSLSEKVFNEVKKMQK